MSRFERVIFWILCLCVAALIRYAYDDLQQNKQVWTALLAQAEVNHAQAELTNSIIFMLFAEELADSIAVRQESGRQQSRRKLTVERIDTISGWEDGSFWSLAPGDSGYNERLEQIARDIEGR
jgi:hypothetical protein